MRAPEGTPPVRDPEVVRAQNATNAQRATQVDPNLPDYFNAGERATADREWGRSYQEYGQARGLLAEAEQYGSSIIPQTNYNAPLRTGDTARAEAAAVVAQSVARRNGSLLQYPTLTRALAEAAAAGIPVTTEDVTRLLNYADVDRAATMIVNGVMNPETGERQELPPQLQYQILLSAGPMQRLAILDAVKAKSLEALNALETADSNLIVQGLGLAAGYVLGPLEWANQQAQQAFRASIVGKDLGNSSITDAARVGFSNLTDPAGWLEAWNETEPGMGSIDPVYVQTLKDSGKYSPLAVDIVVAISEAQAAGSAEPITDAMMQFADTPGAEDIFLGLISRAHADPSLEELTRQVDSANRVSTGQLYVTGVFNPDATVYSAFRGTQSREMVANAASVFYTFALDPTNALFGLGSAFRAAKYSLMKLAPTASREGAGAVLASRMVAGVETNPARRYINAFVTDLAKYDEMLTVDPAKAATMRTVLARQFKEFPEDVIEEFQKQGIRTTDDFIAFVDDTNDAFLIAHGDPTRNASMALAQKLQMDSAVTESTFARYEPMAERMMRRGDMGRREALVPRMSWARRARQLGVQQVSRYFMPNARGRAVIDEFYGNTADAATVAAGVLDNAFPAGQMDQAFAGAGVAGRRVDGITRQFASLANVSHITTFDARDAGVFYKFARTYLTRQHATYLTNAFRDANPAQRRLMVAGLIRTAAGARGVNVAKEEVLGMIDELSTVTRPGELYSAERTLRLSAEPGAVERPWEPITLYHGTNRNFDALSEAAAPRGRHAVTRPDGKRNIYFTDDLDEANRFARESGDSVALPEPDMNRAAYDDLIAKHGSLEGAVDWAMQQFDFYGDVWDDAAKTWVYRKMTKDEVVTNWMDGSSPYGYPKGTAPRVIEQQIDGPVLDLSPLFKLTGKEYDDWVAANVPDGLQQALREEGTFDSVFNRFGGTNWGGHERSAALGDWAWDNGYAAIKVPDKVKGGYSYIVNPKQLEPRTAADTLAAVDDTIVYRPSNFDGEEHALHYWQTTQAVAIPSIADMEALKRYRMFLGRGITSIPQHATDIWSVYTLAGLRFALRSAVEDLWVHAVTSGSLPMLWRGRRMSTALREARPRLTLKRYKHKFAGHDKGDLWLDKDGNARIVVESRLGMFGKRARRVGDVAVSREGRLADIWGTFFLPNLDPDDVVRAAHAARNGDIQPMQRLAITAMARQRMTGVTDEQLAWLGDLVDTQFGLAHLDDLAEAGSLLSRGTLPKELPVQGLDMPNMTAVVLPKNQATVMGDYVDIATSDPWYGMFWFNSIEGIVEHDGPIGKLAVAMLDNRQAAINAVAKAIRDDDTYGYMTQFSAIYSGKATVEQFAARYVDDVRAMFSNENGVINQRLWNRVAPLSDDTGRRNVSLYEVDEDGDRLLKFTAADIARTYGPDGKPALVLGRQQVPVPMPTNELPLLVSPDKLFTWMGEQYARISKEPLFLANYLEQRKLLAGYQAQLAGYIGERAAQRQVAKIASDRAYGFVLAYTDNPANRSQLAWKIRNVSRYYRATEDFYRRMQRVAKNYPNAFWKTALTYQVLDDTGFVFTDDNGDKYFAYPGNEFLLGTITAGLGAVFGTQSMQIDPFFMGGKVKMLAPSTDPNQAVATMMGPVVAPMKILFDRMPAFRGLERYVLGEYSMNQEWWQALIPAQVARVLTLFSADERESIYGNAMMDAIAIAAAGGLIKDQEVDQNGMISTSGFEFSDDFRMLQKIGMGAMVTKFFMGFMPVPASPQIYVDNVTLFARAHGMDNMRDAFLDSVSAFDKDGSANPFGDALVKWFQMNPDLMPFTVSKTMDTPGQEQSLADVQAVQGLRKWYIDNKELYEKYPNAALFLAPRTGEFSWGSWDLITSTLGLKISKDFDTFVRGVLVADDMQVYYATYNDYAAEIATLDPAVDGERIKQLNAERSADLNYLKAANPLLDAELGRDWDQLDLHANIVYSDAKQMVDYLARRGEDTLDSRALGVAIATYEDYMGEISAITGSTNAEDARKRALRASLQADLAVLAAQNANVAQFVKTVLSREPAPAGIGG